MRRRSTSSDACSARCRSDPEAAKRKQRQFLSTVTAVDHGDHAAGYCNWTYPVCSAEVYSFSKVVSLIEATVVGSGEGDDKLTRTLVSAHHLWDHKQCGVDYGIKKIYIARFVHQEEANVIIFRKISC